MHNFCQYPSTVIDLGYESQAFAYESSLVFAYESSKNGGRKTGKTRGQEADSMRLDDKNHKMIIHDTILSALKSFFLS